MYSLDGKAIAKRILETLKEKPRPDKALAAIFVGDNPQSQSFLKQKEKMAQELEIQFQLHRFPETISAQDLIRAIQAIGNDSKVGGMIVQLPLPTGFSRDEIIAAIPPAKDVDALTPQSRALVDPLPVAVLKEILRVTHYHLSIKTVAVVGRGFLVGQPIIEWLKGETRSRTRTGWRQNRKELRQPRCKKLLLFHSKSDLTKIRQADLIITGVGKGGLITQAMIKPGAHLIDFGYDTKEGKIVGDFNPMPYAISHTPLTNIGWYTPTPSGTGPILVAEIFRNFYQLNR